MSSPVSRGFHRRDRPAVDASRVPPGQYVTKDFPVLSAGPTPRTSQQEWTFSVDRAGSRMSWTWDEFRALGADTVTVDIHCVTRWSKLGTVWQGVPVETLLSHVGHQGGDYVIAHSDGGYTTNLPIQDTLGGQAWIAFGFDGRPLEPEHGGPARLLVPHLYFWKSAKWVRRLEILDHDQPGFWESYGYNNYGDPWREQRYSGD
jgi:DMSO/TMAO reductase YedYZ molybdopterin-dependent catalytic subunit